MLRFVELLIGTAALFMVTTQNHPADRPGQPARAGLIPADAIWELAWDDVVDHRLNRSPKTARLKLSVAEGRIAGAFDGAVLGQSRAAVFNGEVVTLGSSPLLLLQQREAGYVCVYQFQKLQKGRFRGVWHDTLGRSGDVVLRLPERRML